KRQTLHGVVPTCSGNVRMPAGEEERESSAARSFPQKLQSLSQESPLSQPLHSAIRWCLAPAEWA
ncbi:hypothetical protein Q2421_25270, partial [Escherichia coli]|nr:hypothetical protein [Escherichia coli]